MLSSEFFRAADINKQEKLRVHLVDLFSLSSEKLVRFAEESRNHIAELDNTRFTEFAKELDMTIPSALPIMNVTKFLLSQFLPDGAAENDTPENLAHDLRELNLIEENQVPDGEAFFNILRSIALGEGGAELNLRAFSEAVLPCVTRISRVVDFRAVFKKRFEYDADGDIGEYKPEYVGNIPVVLVRLAFDDGAVRQISFQADAETLREIIDTLSTAMTEIDVAQKAMELEQATSVREQIKR